MKALSQAEVGSALQIFFNLQQLSQVREQPRGLFISPPRTQMPALLAPVHYWRPLTAPSAHSPLTDSILHEA